MSMNPITFTIDGEPFAKQRHRMTRTGYTYTPVETVRYENLVRMACAAVKPRNWTPWDAGPVIVTINAFFSIPPSWPQWKQAAYEQETVLSEHRRDYDNIAKIVCDALKNVAFQDDRCVSGPVWKWHSRRPRLEVELEFQERPRREKR